MESILLADMLLSVGELGPVGFNWIRLFPVCSLLSTHAQWLPDLICAFRVSSFSLQRSVLELPESALENLRCKSLCSAS